MDVKIGMMGGTVLCLVAVVWFCVKQQVVPSPLAKIESQLAAPANKINAQSPDSKPIVIAPPYKEIQPPVQKPDNAEQIIHTVMQGQTLIDISKIYYNTPSGWTKIYEANKEKLPRGPDMIRAGMRLVIPPYR